MCELIEEIKSLFPLKANVTKEILNKANIWDYEGCIGALTLQSVLPEKFKAQATWCMFTGSITIGDESNSTSITTEGLIDMMEIKSPREVTFIIND